MFTPPAPLMSFVSPTTAFPTTVVAPPPPLDTLAALEDTKIAPQPSLVASLAVTTKMSIPTALVVVIGPSLRKIKSFSSSPIAPPVGAPEPRSIALELESRLELSVKIAPVSACLAKKKHHES
ncbi:unnamed protein product [Linum trigynum]